MTEYDAQGNVAFIPVEGFAKDDEVTIGKGKRKWRIREIGRQEITLWPIDGRKGCRVWYVKNSEASTRLRKAG